ncbi:MAG: O-antigen ligase family protein [Patescibacteria group bacterium]
MSSLERSLLWILRGGLILLLFMPLVVSKSLFFPFITGKNFFFRIIVELLFGIWGALALLYPQYRPQKGPILYALGAFLAILGLATVAGASPYHSFWSNYERMEGLITHLHLFAFFLAMAHAFRSKWDWLYFFHCSLVVSIVVAFHGFLQSVDGGRSDGILHTNKLFLGLQNASLFDPIVGTSRPYAAFGNSIYFGVYLMFHLFIASAFWYSVRCVGWRVAYSIVFLFELYVFFIAASRGAFVGLSAGIALSALFLIFTKRSWHYRVAAGGALAIVAVGLPALVFLFPQHPIVRKVEVLARLSSVSLDQVSQEPRIMIWRMGWQAFKERPILGWGPENFIIPYGKYYDPNLFSNEAWFDRTHNMLLEWLVATGVLGFVAYVSIFAAVGIVLRRLVRNRELDPFMAVLIVSFLLAYIIQDIFVFDNTVTYILVFSLLAFLHALSAPSAKKVSTQANPTLAVLPIIASIFVVWILNVPHISMAKEIITTLGSFGRAKSVQEVLDQFDKVTQQNVFGRAEAREQFANQLVEAATSVQGPNEAYLALLDRSIVEIEAEAKEQPQVARYPIFSGKLYTIRFSMTKKGYEEAERHYHRAQELAPDYVQIDLGLAELYTIAGESDKALAAAFSAYHKPTKQSTIGALFYPVLSVHILAERYTEAIAFVNNYSEDDLRSLFNPNGSGADIQLAVERALSRGKNLEGRKVFLEFLDQKADSPYISIGLAQTHSQLGDNRTACRYAREAAAGDSVLGEQIKGFLDQC